ncbi:MAG: hypothetical protein MPK11_02730 [Gammaproteobacteria bacterium]|nr:hypothetical protein [Gammaproteobacteria bacterium]MDA7969683.1 hypothetical protein [Gammaproteobacteria bacterium]MDA7996358.1 hypothetical protein [Gammaproteobacteria bacterium]MDA8024684.1 hypothetical protein [Gammaproteobacteria bacterium]CAJ2377586.1 MAG: hypothetical protein IBGAMO2_840003 [Arenicellales bacterium IbO2]
MKFWGRKKAAQLARRRGASWLRLRARILRNSRAVEQTLRGASAVAFIDKQRALRAPPAAANPKEARRDYLPVGILEAGAARRIGAKSRVVRLTDRVADKQWHAHGGGLQYLPLSPSKRKRRAVPAAWYADIPKLLRETKPYRNHKNRWQFDHAGLKRRLVLDLDEDGNPVVISYHPKENLK